MSELLRMLVLRNVNCGHVFMAERNGRTRLQSAQAHLVTELGRRDFRIQTVNSPDQARDYLLALKRGDHCAVCLVNRPPADAP